MSIENCVMCRGQGKIIVLKYKKYNEVYPYYESYIEGYAERRCEYCKGKGWILIEDE